MKLADYLGESVSLVDCDGKVWVGIVHAYTSAINSEDGQEEIAILTKDGMLIGFTLPEIKTIEVV